MLPQQAIIGMMNIWIVLVYITGTLAHVSLTFPPARKFDLDFLDSSRTKAPCGMPRGTIRTIFVEGSNVNVSWHLAYPHRGGFRLQLLDALERPVLDLTPSDEKSKFLKEDVTAQQFQVHFPSNYTCENCTLRLLREASEWGKDYLFWSCADIDIKQRKQFRETCSGKGKYFPSRCRCDKRYYGDRCQFWNECDENADCGAHGECVHQNGTTHPRQQCYCKMGWFGPGCNKKSIVKASDVDLTLYSNRTITPAYDLYWRILQESKEIEMVLLINGTSWVGIGWRPNNLTKACRAFPHIQAMNTTENTTASDSFVPRHDFSAMDCTDIVIGSAKGESSRIWDYYTRDRSTPRLDTFWGGKFDLTSASGIEVDGITTITFRRKLLAKEPTDHAIGNDMHLIWAKGQEPDQYIHVPKSGLETEKASVQDFYQSDELKYHGQKTQRGVLSIDFQVEQDIQKMTNNDATPAQTNACEGFWSYPRHCTDNCTYSMTWVSLGSDETGVRFTITTSDTVKWTGIGFSNDTKMAHTDAIIGWIDTNGRPYVMDTWIYSYSMPRPDAVQNVYNVSGRVVNGVRTIEFSRRIVRDDKEDLHFSDSECFFFIYPVLGGMFDNKQKKTRKHEKTPFVSEERVCVKSCPREIVDSTVLKGGSEFKIYFVKVKLRNDTNDESLPIINSTEHSRLSKSLTDSLSAILKKKSSNFFKMDILSWEKEKDAMAVAINVVMNQNSPKEMKDASESSKNIGPNEDEQKLLESVFTQLIQTEKIGSFGFDHQFLEFKDTSSDNQDERRFVVDSATVTTLFWVVIAFAVLGLVQVWCTFRNKGSNSIYGIK